MPPEPRDPLDPLEWLRRARSNLAGARAGAITSEVLYEDACFDAQQAAKKAIKAVLVKQKIAFPKTHSIARTLGIALASNIEVPDEIREASGLTIYASFGRYPGPTEDVTKEQYAEAVQMAERVVVGHTFAAGRS